MMSGEWSMLNLELWIMNLIAFRAERYLLYIELGMQKRQDGYQLLKIKYGWCFYLGAQNVLQCAKSGLVKFGHSTQLLNLAEMQSVISVIIIHNP
jgi:hypothetical protein